MREARKLVELVNQRLRAGKFGVTLCLHGVDDWLSVRGTFPPRPDDVRTKPYQTRIALKIRAIDKASIKLAEATAREIGLDLNLGRFDWRKFSDYQDPNQRTVGEWIAELEHWHWQQVVDTPSARNTWRQTYASTLKHLPADAMLTPQLVQDWIFEHSQPNTRRRGHFLTAGKALLKRADLPIAPLTELSNVTTSKPVNPRSLPSDAAIAQIVQALADPKWKWAIGMMATYGLRNHEVFKLDITQYPLIRVTEGKTGARSVKPLYPQWAEAWRLDARQYPPGCESGNHAQLGAKVTQAFQALPCRAYDLRHAYARRCAEFGIPPQVAARLMGHSLEMHCRVYQAWIGEKVFLDQVDRAIAQSALTPPSL